MADQREFLTDKCIARLFSGEKQDKVRASELSEFFVLVEKHARCSWLEANSCVTVLVNSQREQRRGTSRIFQKSTP